MTETDKAFLDDAPFLWNTRRLTDEDFHRLFTLALRGAKIPEMVNLLDRAAEELRLIRMKDSAVVYDVGLRTELSNVRAMIKTALEGK